MTRVEEAVEIEVAVQAAYNQWTQFAQFPRFMEGVREVRQVDDAHLHWIGDCNGHQMEWDTELTQQVPDQLIAWRSTSGAANTGSVHFTPLDAHRTRVQLQMSTESPHDGNGTPEDVRTLSERVRQDMQRFKTMLERQGSESGAWRGAIKDGHVLDNGERTDNDAGDGHRHILGHGLHETSADSAVPPRHGSSSAHWLPHLSSMWEEPFSVMRRMTEEMEHAMERFIGRAPMLAGISRVPQWTPAVEVCQQGDQLLISADLPGLSRADVSVEVRGDKLIIEGQRQENLQSGDPIRHRTERRFGRFYRMIALPHGADAETAQASMQDGVLQIRMPIADLQTHGRNIQIHERHPGGEEPAAPALGQVDGSTDAVQGSPPGDTMSPPLSLH